jgi:hypothetical protein
VLCLNKAGTVLCNLPGRTVQHTGGATGGISSGNLIASTGYDRHCAAYRWVANHQAAW